MTAPNIEGTYRLTHRERPDGTVERYPEIRGTLSFSRDIRQFSIIWRDDAGKLQSRCYVARYKISEKAYEETADYLIDGDEETSTTRHEVAQMTASSPISLDGDTLSFDLPQSFEKVLSIRAEFRGDTLVTSAKDLFKDFWERVP